MEEYTIVGKRNVDYTNKQGRQVTGIQLFVTCKDAHVLGDKTDQLYISNASTCYKTCMSYEVGTVVLVSYNRYGQVADVTAKIK